MILRIIKTTALIFSVILAFGAGAYLTLTFIIKGEDTVVVPDLVGKEVVYALEVLTDLGLNTKIRGSEYSANVPKNHVIHQDPEPGAEIKKDRDVRIVVSKGASFVMMPNLMALSLAQAHIILEENGLCPGQMSETYSTTVKKDEVIAQVPEPGDTIKRGACVDLLISLGVRSETLAMADLTGLGLDDAILLIERNHLVLGEIKSEYSTDKPKNVIVGQDPSSGYAVGQGHAVNLVINRKPGAKAERTLQASKGAGLFRFRLKSGFLKRHITVRVNIFGISSDLIDTFMAPGEEVWLLIPGNRTSTVFLYEDEELILTQVFDGG